jgi:hypothetical protein
MKTAIVDDRHRIRIPDLKPGQVFAWEDNGNGQITLLEVQPKAKEPRKPSILDGLKPFTKEECEECWGPQTDGDENDRIAEAMSKLPVPLPKDT